MVSRERAKAQWAGRTEEDRADVALKISASVKALHVEGSEYRKNNLKGLAKGRANMDRAIQGAAASKGIKAFWVELKKDPEKYAAYISKRRETLMRTLECKK